MTEQFILGGQKITYNPENKILKITIQEAFIRAGIKLSWNESFGSPGLGFNQKIIERVIRTGAYLCVHVEKQSADYWIKNDVLIDFIKKNNSEYRVSSTILNVIPWKLFTRYPNFAMEMKH